MTADLHTTSLGGRHLHRSRRPRRGPLGSCRRVLRPLVLVAAVLGLGTTAATACGASGHGATDTGAPITAGTPPPPSTQNADAKLAQDKADITATIVEFNRLFDQAAGVPSSPSPSLFALVDDPAATSLRRDLANRVATHQAGHLPTPSQARTTVSAVSISDDVATATECTVSDLVVTDSRTGRILNDQIATYLYSDTLVRNKAAPHNWTITTTQSAQRWEGIAGCALER